MQVHGWMVTEDAKWRHQTDQWAKKYDATIEDGPCGDTWGKVVKDTTHDKMHIKVFMQ